MIFHPVKKRIVRRRYDARTAPHFGDVSPLLQRIYAGRKLAASDEIDHSLNRLPSPWLLAGMEAMVEHLADAIRGRQSILIVADFDADGATSCAVAMRGLAALGAARVDFIVPNRFEFGYGLTPEIVQAARVKRPQVLVTVDNGISSLDGVGTAKDLGWRVLITDHHLPGAELPAADAIVNPNLRGDPFPGKSLAGVGVMFYVLTALRSRLREGGWFHAGCPEPNLADLLDYVALGTVADVVPLDRVNRILVHQGLQRIRSGRAHPGIAALLQIAGRDRSLLTGEDLGFAAAPRLNAAGRLEDMSLGIECLLANDPETALPLARRLDELNAQRREIEHRMKADALQSLAKVEEAGVFGEAKGICLFDESWHQGVIGLLASRIKERLHRPVIAFAPGQDTELKGSARSIPGVHIRDLLHEIATLHPGLLSRFGGHAMAAGLSIERRRLERFTRVFEDAVEIRLRDLDPEQTIQTDGDLPAEHFDLSTAEMLKRAAPWGQAFPEPAFDGSFRVLQRRIVGQRHVKFVLQVPGNERPVDGIAFSVDEPEKWLKCDRLRATYRLDINDYQNCRALQLKIDYMESAGCDRPAGPGRCDAGEREAGPNA